MLESIFSENLVRIEGSDVIICMLVSLMLGIVIAYTYKWTSKYTKNFLVTLTILPVLVQLVILMVNGNLGTSIATVGAFSLVRFRSLPGTSKEIVCVFFAMAIGLATGMGHIYFAILITIIVSLAILIFSKWKGYNPSSKDCILHITIPENLDYTNLFEEIFDQYAKDVELMKVKTTNMGSLFELKYHITLLKDKNEKEFIDELRVKNGNLKVMLSHYFEDAEM